MNLPGLNGMQPVSIWRDCVNSFGLIVGISLLIVACDQNGSDDSPLDEVDALLMASIEKAPELDRIQASSALARLNTHEDDPAIRLRVHWAKSLLAMQQGDLSSSLSDLREAHALAKTSRQRSMLLTIEAEILRQQLKPSLARTQLEKAVKADAENLRARLLRASLRLEEDDAKGAVFDLRKVLAGQPNVGHVHNELGLALEQLGALQESEKHFRDAVRFDSRLGAAFCNLGRHALFSGRTEEALSAYDKALTIDSEDPDAMLGRGLALAAAGQFERAVESLTIANKLAPSDDRPLIALGDLLRSSDASAAETFYRSALALIDDNPASFLKLGNVLAQSGECAEAVGIFEKAIALSPSLGSAYNGLGVCQRHMGEASAAAKSFRKATVLTPQDGAAWINLAMALSQTGKQGEAKLAFQHVLNVAPHSEYARVARSRLKES